MKSNEEEIPGIGVCLVDLRDSLFKDDTETLDKIEFKGDYTKHQMHFWTQKLYKYIYVKFKSPAAVFLLLL